MITAITFDLWDTLVVDDSDEADRAAAGLASKPEARAAALVAEVQAHHDVPEATIRQAFDAANAWFRHAWKVEHHTPHLSERLGRAYQELGLDRTPGFDDLVEHLASMEVVHPPRTTPNVRACLEALKGRWPLGIVSDAIVTPGSHLRRLLAQHELDGFFDHFVFSDEVGASKPDPAVFAAAAEGLGVDVAGIVHIGDREANDIAGPVAAGCRGVLYVGAIDRGRQGTRAAAVCEDLADLPDLLAALG